VYTGLVGRYIEVHGTCFRNLAFVLSSIFRLFPLRSCQIN
jgi:hypothetical protein